MTSILAIAVLRFREGLAARISLLVALAFLAGIGAAVWAPGGDAAARSAVADRASLGLAFTMALLVAVVLPGLGFPRDLKQKRAFSLLAAPVSRFAVVLGGALGYGAVASVLLLASATAALLGLALGGAPDREELRDFVPVVAVSSTSVSTAPGDAGEIVLDRENPEARFRVVLPDGSADGELLPIRLHVRGQYQAGEQWHRTTGVEFALIQGGDELPVSHEVQFHPVDVGEATLPLPMLEPGADIELRVRRLPRGWRLTLAPGALTVGLATQPFGWNVMKAALCAVPLLFLAGAAAQCGALRFGSPTALGLALTLLLLFAGQDVLREAAGSVKRAAEDAALREAEAAAHAGHNHGPGGHGGGAEEEAHDHAIEVGRVQLALARATDSVLRFLPAPAPFDRSGDLVERVAIPPSAIGRAVLVALGPFVGLVGLGWILVRRRELIPS